MVATIQRKRKANSRRISPEMVSSETSGMHVFASDLGYMAFCWRNEVLTGLTFGHPSSAAAAAHFGNIEYSREIEGLPLSILQLRDRLQLFAAGLDDNFRDIPLHLDHLTPFQLRVVNACRRIPAGKVKSYGDLAAAAGSPRAARAVGNVMRSNRYPLLVPCHRVIGSDGKLCGFTSPEGLSMKQRLLMREGAWPRS